MDPREGNNFMAATKHMNNILDTLEEFPLSMTMLMTLIPVVKDHNDYICFSYYGRVVMDI